MLKTIQIKVPSYLTMLIVYIQTGGHNFFQQHEIREHLSSLEHLNEVLETLLTEHTAGNRTVSKFFTSQITNLNKLLENEGEIKYLLEDIWSIFENKELHIDFNDKNKPEYFLIFNANNHSENIQARLVAQLIRMSGLNKFINDYSYGVIPGLIEQGTNYGVLELVSRNFDHKLSEDRQSGANKCFHFLSYEGEVVLLRKKRNDLKLSSIYAGNGLLKSNTDIFHAILDVVHENEIARALREYDIIPKAEPIWKYIEKNLASFTLSEADSYLLED